MEINSPMNEKVKNWAKLQQKKYRDQTGQFLIEGEHLIGEALKAGVVELLLVEAGRTNPFHQEKEAIVCSESVMRKLSANVSGAWLIAVCAQKVSRKSRNSRIVALDGVQDPGNVGTILRTLDAFEADGLVLLPGCADPFSPKTVRSSMGAVFRRPVWRCAPAQVKALLSAAGIPLWGAALRCDTVDARQVDYTRAAVAIGSEGRGLSEEVLALCDQTIRLPMSERCESLNAAVAAAVLLWEMYR